MRSRSKVPSKRPQSQVTDLEQRYVIDGITHEAKGVARHQGKVTFIEGALIGETVTAKVVQSNRRFDEATLIKIEEASPDRISPACIHYHECGGCQFQHVQYEQQLHAKQGWLKNQFRHLAIKEITLLTGSPFGYRRRARLAVHVSKQSVSLGFRAKSSAHIVAVKECLVLTEPLQQLLKPLYEFFPVLTQAQNIGHIELLNDDLGTAMVIRLTAEITAGEVALWEQFAKDKQTTLFWQYFDEQKAQVALSELRQYSALSLPVSFHPQDFVQVNDEMNQKMLAQALDWLALTEKDVVLDLFCGSGNFALPLAQQVTKVIGVELLDSMVNNARENAKLLGLEGATFIAADLTKVNHQDVFPKTITKIVLDPPRAGAFEFLPNIIKQSPDKILYVSCNAATLARDAEFLLANGYQVAKVALMDMFPQTAHVETMMLLQKSSKSKRKKVLKW